MSARILVVEDETLIAFMIEDAVVSLGLTPVGPCMTLEDALRAAKAEPLDGAVLDVNLGGRLSYPVAELLMQRKVPFLFATGYGASITDEFPNALVINKPFEETEISAALLGLLKTSA